MCTNPCCLGTDWCSQWGCCKPPEFEVDDSDFEEPPAKKTTPRFASPVSPIKIDTIFRGCVLPNTKKATSWAVRAFEQWRDQRNEKANLQPVVTFWGFQLATSWKIYVLPMISWEIRILPRMPWVVQDVMSILLLWCSGRPGYNIDKPLGFV